MTPMTQDEKLDAIMTRLKGIQDRLEEIAEQQDGRWEEVIEKFQNLDLPGESLEQYLD
jgi:hypothetical protein